LDKSFVEQRDSAEGTITREGVTALRRRIGIVTPQEWPGHEFASRDGIRCYSEGIGDSNPFYRDPEYASGTRWKKLAARPSMMLYMGVSEKKELTPIEKAIGRGGGLPGVHGMYSGDKLEWFRPIYEGDRLTVKGGLAKVEEKASEFSGNTIHETRDRVYWNQHGELVGVARSLIIRTERTEARGARKYLDIPIQTYTPEDMARIDADYEREEIRGANPRYWEDVTIGEEIVPVVKGPWCPTCYVIFAEGTGHRNEFHKAHSLAFKYRKRHPNAFPLNEYGFYDTIMRVHWEPKMAQITGLPGCYDFGGERIGWMEHGVTNWMGDDGFLRKLSVQIRRFCVTGDTTWIKGKVTDKRIEDGEYWVELDIWADNQRGETTATGKASVLLPSLADGPVKIPAKIQKNISIFAE
jgi:acyl dehydratase